MWKQAISWWKKNRKKSRIIWLVRQIWSCLLFSTDLNSFITAVCRNIVNNEMFVKPGCSTMKKPFWRRDKWSSSNNKQIDTDSPLHCRDRSYVLPQRYVQINAVWSSADLTAKTIIRLFQLYNKADNDIFPQPECENMTLSDIEVEENKFPFQVYHRYGTYVY